MKKPPSDIEIQMDSLVVSKKLLTKEYIEQKWISGFMVKRFISFCSNDINLLKHLIPFLDKIKVGVFDSKWEEYIYMYNILPKIPKAKFYYVSKKSVKKNKDEVDSKKVKELANMLEISQKECKYFIENNFIDTNYE